jgi:hypothetical protein
VAVHLVDASHCGDPAKFIAAALLSLTAMIRLELPHVNVLSKVDLLAQQGGGSDDGGGGGGFDLDFFSDLTDISHLAYQLRAASGLLPQDEGASDSADAAASSPPATAGSSSGPEDGAAAASAADAQRLAVGRKRRATLRSRYARLHDKLAEIVDDHSLVGFVPLSLAVSAAGRPLDAGSGLRCACASTTHARPRLTPQPLTPLLRSRSIPRRSRPGCSR